MISFVNLLIIPFITCGIWSRRKVFSLDFSFESLGIYSMAVALNMIVCYIGAHLIMRITGDYPFSDQQIYTIMSFVAAVLIAYITELIRKYFDFRFEIKAKK